MLRMMNGDQRRPPLNRVLGVLERLELSKGRRELARLEQIRRRAVVTGWLAHQRANEQQTVDAQRLSHVVKEAALQEIDVQYQVICRRGDRRDVEIHLAWHDLE